MEICLGCTPQLFNITSEREREKHKIFQKNLYILWASRENGAKKTEINSQRRANARPFDEKQSVGSWYGLAVRKHQIYQYRKL